MIEIVLLLLLVCMMEERGHNLQGYLVVFCNHQIKYILDLFYWRKPSPSLWVVYYLYIYGEYVTSTMPTIWLWMTTNGNTIAKLIYDHPFKMSIWHFESTWQVQWQQFEVDFGKAKHFDTNRPMMLDSNKAYMLMNV